VRKQIVPPFEAEYKCKVYTTQGVTLEQIALMRATRNNPKYSVMFIDDIGVDLAKKEGLIEQLPADQIPNMKTAAEALCVQRRVRGGIRDVVGRLVYNSETGKPLVTYGELWEPRFRKRFLMTSPKSTQSLYLLIAAVSVETGKPYAETQYLIEKSWDKMEALKPNVLSTFDNAATVMQVAQGQADIAGLSFSKSVYPYTVKERRSTCAFRAKARCRHQLSDLGQGRAGPRARHRLHQPHARPGSATGAGEATLAAPTISGLEFKPELAKYMAYPEARWTRWASSAPTGRSSIRSARACSKKYNQVFGA